MSQRIKDRTTEFFAAVNIKSQTTFGGAYQGLRSGDVPLSPKSALRHHSEFTSAALDINNGIQSLLNKLEKLTKRTIVIIYCFEYIYLVANTKRIYDDRSAEVKELTFIIKKDLTDLTRRLDGLKSAQTGGNQATSDHKAGVVSLLHGRLTNLSNQFTTVLQTSSSNMRAQRERREQFGATGTLSASQRPAAKQRSGTASVEDSTHVAIEMPFQKLALAEQADSTQYLESRNTALQGIESTINELGAIYQQLAHMIAQQGETVQRIDFDIESMQMNVTRGQEQLMRYLRSVSSNRSLMIKIFAVLIIFTLMFMFFFT